MAALPTRQRTAVVLRFVADLTESQIAQAMGVSRSTVSSTLSDALAALHRVLAESSGGVEPPNGSGPGAQSEAATPAGEPHG